MGMSTYLVVAPNGVVVDDAGSSVSYMAGAVFSANSKNPSIVRHLSSRAIVQAQASKPSSLSTQQLTVVAGPPGPPGPAGGPAGGYASCKIRTSPNTLPVVVRDTGAQEVVAFPDNVERLFDQAGMYDPTRKCIVVRDGNIGRYLVVADVRFSVEDNGLRQVEILHLDPGGSIKDRSSSVCQAVAGSETAVSVAAVFDGYVGDCFCVTVRQTSGLTLTAGVSLTAMLQGSGPEGRPGRPGLRWRGHWSRDVSYVFGDVVELNASSYVASIDNTNVQPAADPLDQSSTWQLLSAGESFDDDPGVFITNRWLTLKARLDAVPPPGNPYDHFATARQRITNEMSELMSRLLAIGGPR